MSEECALSTGKIPLGGLLRDSVVGINRCPDMISVVYLNVNSAINLSTDQPTKQKSLDFNTFFVTSQRICNMEMMY